MAIRSYVRFPLRWRLLLLTAGIPAALALGTYTYLSRSVTDQARRDAHESLERAALVFERQFADRSEALAITARVIARDPRFFSAVALGGATDAGARATVRGVALDFESLTHADVFEVWDRKGGLLASVGSARPEPGARAPLLAAVARGEEARGVLADSGGHWQVALAPVTADGARVGGVLLGRSIGPALARELHVLTRGEVSLVSGGQVTGTSFTDGAGATIALLGLASGARAAGPVEIAAAGDSWITLARPLPGTDPAAGHWFVIQRSLAAETAFLRRAQQALLMLALLVVAIAAVLGAVTAEGLTRPILALVRGAEAMERGDYDAPIEASGRDEIGYLATRFRAMQAREREVVRNLRDVARQKSDFISLASHQLRTPVTVIKGYHDLLADGMLGEISDRQRDAFTRIDESLGDLIKLTEDASWFANIDGEGLDIGATDQDLGAVVRAAVDVAVRDGRSRAVSVSCTVEDGLPPVQVDGAKLGQAVANLVRNGIRFTPDGGRVDVRVGLERGAVAIAVADTGVGIDAVQQERIFSSAFGVRDVLHHHSSSRLEFRSAGLGLGLAIARGIVEAHGGSIDLVSEPGAGSVFTIRLPRLAGIVALDPTRPRPAQDAAHDSGTTTRAAA